MAVLLALLCATAFSSSAALDVGTLRLPAAVPTFNPAHLATRKLLMRQLDVRTMDVEVLVANGGLNGGVWVLSDPRRTWKDMVIKLRPVEPDLPSHPGEARHFVNLASMHPGLAQDPEVVFPSRILSVVDAYGSKRGDLIVMPKAPGMTLARFIFDKHYARLSAGEEFMAVFESVGRQLRAFHSHYGKQHGDFHSANIMVDAENGNRVTFIDLGGMGLPIGDTDVQHLLQDLRLHSAAYRPDTFLERCMFRFERGYNSAPAGHPSPSQRGFSSSTGPSLVRAGHALPSHPRPALTQAPPLLSAAVSAPSLLERPPLWQAAVANPMAYRSPSIGPLR